MSMEFFRRMSNQPKQIIIFILFLIVSVSLGVFYSHPHGKSIYQKDIHTVFSIKEEAKKIYIQKEYIESKFLFSSQLIKNDNNLNVERENILKLKNSYEKKFMQDDMAIASQMSELEHEHYALLAEMRKYGLEIDPVINLRPRLKVALAYFLGLNPGELGIPDVEKISLTRQEWYLVKTFSESNDFITMLKRKKLNSNFMQIQNLVKYYATNK